MSEYVVDMEKYAKNQYEKSEIKKYGAPKRIIDELFDYVKTSYRKDNMEELMQLVKDKVVSLRTFYFYVEGIQSYIRQAEVLPENAYETYDIAYTLSFAAWKINNNSGFYNRRREKYVPTPEEREERRARKEATQKEQAKQDKKNCPAKRAVKYVASYGRMHAGRCK